MYYLPYSLGLKWYKPLPIFHQKVYQRLTDRGSMAAKNQISDRPFIVTETRPHTISIFFDGQEVQRIEGGVDTFVMRGVSKDYTPEIIQEYWDDELVLELFPKLDLLTVNRLPIPRTNQDLASYGALN